MYLEAEAVKILADALQAVDLNHPQAVDISNSIVRSLDLLSKAALTRAGPDRVWQEPLDKEILEAGSDDIIIEALPIRCNFDTNTNMEISVEVSDLRVHMNRYDRFYAEDAEAAFHNMNRIDRRVPPEREANQEYESDSEVDEEEEEERMHMHDHHDDMEEVRIYTITIIFFGSNKNARSMKKGMKMMKEMKGKRMTKSLMKRKGKMLFLVRKYTDLKFIIDVYLRNGRRCTATYRSNPCRGEF